MIAASAALHFWRGLFKLSTPSDYAFDGNRPGSGAAIRLTISAVERDRSPEVDRTIRDAEQLPRTKRDAVHGKTSDARLGRTYSAFACLPSLSTHREVLRVPLSGDIGTFDPDNGFETAGIGAINSVYEGLVECEAGSTKIVGSLAKNWDISQDGLTYTFHLVEGVRFHDGTPFNAAAAVKSFERRRDRGLILSYFLSNVTEIRAPDDKTIVLTLRSPQPSLLDSLASPWGPKVISPARA